jgi:hypothetical protein
MDALLVVPAPMKAMNEERLHRKFFVEGKCRPIGSLPATLSFDLIYISEVLNSKSAGS